MKYADALEYLESLKPIKDIQGLAAMSGLCGQLLDPQDHLKCIHIAGTNGKSSVLSFLSSVLMSAGYRVGTFGSPALCDEYDRIRVNGRCMTRKGFGEGMDLIKAASDQLLESGLPHPAKEEVVSALAFWYFDKKQCDIVILEASVGGREDPTNVILKPMVSVITSVSMDHMNVLGKTLEEIAYQCAGIMKAGCPVVTPCQSYEVMEVLTEEAALLQCSFVVADDSFAEKIRYSLNKQCFAYKQWKDIEIGLLGLFQIENAVLALEVLKVLQEQGLKISEVAVRKGLVQAQCRGRFTIIGKKPLFVVDGAHNEDAAKKLAESVNRFIPDKRIIYIVGVEKEKECEKIIAMPHQYADQIITVTPPNSQRGMSAYSLACEVARLHPNVTAADSPEEALEISYLLARKEDVILAFGDLTCVSRIMELVEKRNGQK